MIPFIHVNCAMSADGKIAGPERKQLRISSDEDLVRVKGLRMQYDAILVGVGTIVSDDPHLTVKGLSYDENPLRIVLDPNGRTPDDALVLDDRAPTVIVTNEDCSKTWKNAKVIRSGKRIELREVLEFLADSGIESVLVEGGGRTIASFFAEGLVDRYTVFVGGMVIGGKDSPTPADGPLKIGKELKLLSSEVSGNGVILTYDVH